MLYFSTLPDHIRSDCGGENVAIAGGENVAIAIWRYMIASHNHDYSSVITGSFIHKRIERLWRDMHRCVGSNYIDLE